MHNMNQLAAVGMTYLLTAIGLGAQTQCATGVQAVFTLEPQSQALPCGQNMTLRAMVPGTTLGNYTYHWFKSVGVSLPQYLGSGISTVTAQGVESALTISNAAQCDAGYYYADCFGCFLAFGSSGAGFYELSISSGAALVTVIGSCASSPVLPPSASTTPSGAGLNSGGVLSLVDALGGPPVMGLNRPVRLRLAGVPQGSIGTFLLPVVSRDFTFIPGLTGLYPLLSVDTSNSLGIPLFYVSDPLAVASIQLAEATTAANWESEPFVVPPELAGISLCIAVYSITPNLSQFLACSQNFISLGLDANGMLGLLLAARVEPRIALAAFGAIVATCLVTTTSFHISTSLIAVPGCIP